MRDARALVEETRASMLGQRTPMVLVDGDSYADCEAATYAAALVALSEVSGVRVVIDREGRTPPEVRALADLVLTSGGGRIPRDAVATDDPTDLARRLAAAAAAVPVATWSLVQVLRATERLDVSTGLAVESAAYSTLLGGAEFRAWLSRRPPPRPIDEHPRLVLSREADDLMVTLDRPGRRNAYDARMRDALVEALEMARHDPDLRIVLRAEGEDFCAGGDLDEFGSATDLAVAHELRVRTSVGGLVHGLRDRVRVDLHGRCIGSGVEIPAFAAEVRAREGTTLRLPELSMGLIPGAGGTVSLTRRMGRHRLLWWLLSGSALEAQRAREWGVVDVVEP